MLFNKIVFKFFFSLNPWQVLVKGYSGLVKYAGMYFSWAVFSLGFFIKLMQFVSQMLNSTVKPPVRKVFLVGRLLITDKISLLLMTIQIFFFSVFF